jgi:hypothetical protein
MKNKEKHCAVLFECWSHLVATKSTESEHKATQCATSYKRASHSKPTRVCLSCNWNLSKKST